MSCKSHRAMCLLLYMKLLMVGIMPRFSNQRKLNLAHMRWEHIFQSIYITFSDSYLVHEMSLRQKRNLWPPQDKAWGLNIHDRKCAFGPIWSKYAIQPQIKHSQVLTVKFHQPSHEFTLGVGMSFISYTLVLTPLIKQVHSCMRFWSLVFMQGFDIESKTSEISSSSTLIRLWNPVQVMQWSKLDSKKPRDLTREDDKLRGHSRKSAKSCGIRSFIQLEEKLTTRAHMQKGEGGRQLGRGWPRLVGPSRPAQPIPGPSHLPLWPGRHLGYL
jgi:hypothetical protein